MFEEWGINEWGALVGILVAMGGAISWIWGLSRPVGSSDRPLNPALQAASKTTQGNNIMSTMLGAIAAAELVEHHDPIKDIVLPAIQPDSSIAPQVAAAAPVTNYTTRDGHSSEGSGPHTSSPVADTGTVAGPIHNFPVDAGGGIDLSDVVGPASGGVNALTANLQSLDDIAQIAGTISHDDLDHIVDVMTVVIDST